MKVYNVIGLMSGTSLDGLDIAYCTLKFNKDKWSYILNCAETIKYSKEWYFKLKEAHFLSGEKLLQLHSEYGNFLGNKINGFIKKQKIRKVDFISSHGHTVFHRPEYGYTFQLGNGASIASTCRIKVVYDFRILDISLNGQGAPLVPIGDRLLFPEYDFCLNLGGFSNISFENKKDRIAFDICPVNTVLNHLASSKGKEYDKDGKLAKSGKVHTGLLQKLNKLEYYHRRAPKSLGREWLSSYFLPVIDSGSISIEDKLATVIEHIAIQISNAILSKSKKGKILITGGGTNNSFLIEKIKQKLPTNLITVPDQSLVNFKEALVFALLGILKIEQKINTLHTVTGADRDSSGGVVLIP